MREINFEHYKIFYYVAKFQNITMAANYLFFVAAEHKPMRKKS